MIGWGATLDIYENNSGASVLNGIAGRSYDASAGYTLMGGYSIPIDQRSGNMTNEGVHKVSIGLGTGVRAGTSITKRFW